MQFVLRLEGVLLWKETRAATALPENAERRCQVIGRLAPPGYQLQRGWRRHVGGPILNIARLKGHFTPQTLLLPALNHTPRW
jgi:hypothetical protein